MEMVKATLQVEYEFFVTDETVELLKNGNEKEAKEKVMLYASNKRLLDNLTPKNANIKLKMVNRDV